MAKEKIVYLPTALSLGEAWGIVKNGLNDEAISIQSKVIAIRMVAQMETHNSISKDDLVSALRWMFEHYDFEV